MGAAHHSFAWFLLRIKVASSLLNAAAGDKRLGVAGILHMSVHIVYSFGIESVARAGHVAFVDGIFQKTE